jgi:imidazolonepropionase-like amidohydrolase
VVYHCWAKGDAARERLARPEMRYVSPFMLAAWDPGSPRSYLATMPDELVARAHAAIPFMQRAVAALSDAGVGLVAGTDMGNPFVTAGFALHEELGLLAGAGLTPFEVLRAATSDAARCMDAADDWGAVAVGRRADLLLLEADPLEDVAHAARRVGVVLNGRWLPAAELATELERRAESFGR